MPMNKKNNMNQIIMDGLWNNNPVFFQILGICSSLAVTNLVMNTIVMCAGLAISTALSCHTISMLRDWTPRRVRMMVQTLVIAFYVILIDLALKAFWPEMSKNLGPYVGLIITNCIIMGRCEAFAASNPPTASFIDGLFNGIGYSYILILISVFRELFGMGKILGIPIPYFYDNFDKWIIMVMPPGAFFTLATVIWIFRTIKAKKEAKTS